MRALCTRRENYRRAFNMNRTFLATLFFFCLMVAPHVPQFVIAGACGSKFTAVGSIPLAAQLQAAAAAAAAGNSTNSTSGPSPAYGTCSSVFPNITGVAMPSVGNNNTQLQNMAQVSCVGSGTTYWVAGINNQCNAPACFTSAGVACTAGTAGCPCTIVTACTPQVATAPVPCLLCPPTPCVVCPPVPPPPPPSPPPPPVAIISSDANYTNAVTAAAAIANGTSVLVGRRLSIFGGGASGGGGSRGGGGGGGYVAPSNNNYHNNNNNGGGGAPAGPAPPSMECVSADCQSCSQHISSVIGPIVGFVMLAFIIFAGYMRNRLHKAYNIQKDQFCCVEDSWLPWLVCYPLALCQEARTIDVMERDQELVEGIQDPQAAPLMKQLKGARHRDATHL